VAGAVASAGSARPDDPGAGPPSSPASLLLLTLDTTRADALGSYGARLASPALDGLAARGTRFARAITASPLTLPAHCSLLTGLDPPAHGVRDNGAAALPPALPTLATVLARRGYATGAFVASRVLDRRFGLARGFSVYDDHMAAERVGEKGYPERDAAAVTTAALGWGGRLPPARPFFLWVHYYDPHAPYAPPGDWSGASAARRYAGEVAYVDREIGRLLAGLPLPAERVLVAAVGDHGEMLGEHEEEGHGLFLYRGSLEVPLILAGPGVPSGRVVATTVATRGLAATLLGLLGAADDAASFGPALPGPSDTRANAIYSETFLPATAYGWSPLRAITEGSWRLIQAPRPELYDFVSDPGESRNLYRLQSRVRRRLEGVLGRKRAVKTAAPAPPPHAELAESLRSLGYLSGMSGRREGTIDPKDGLALLSEFERTKRDLQAGRRLQALTALEDLVRRSPDSVPFLTRLARAQSVWGRKEEALATLKRAVALNPGLDFLHLRLAEESLEQGRLAEARAAYERALALNPRFAPAWLGLGEVGRRAGGDEEEREVLLKAAASGTESAALAARLAQLDLAAGRLESADRYAEEAVRLLPEYSAAWWLLGEAAEGQGRAKEAIERYEKAVALGLARPEALLHLGRLLLARGEGARARFHLARAAELGRGTPVGEEARLMLP
jgi:arylsulfatase A-like enzyme/Flp pilus assembly protein TadD